MVASRYRAGAGRVTRPERVVQAGQVHRPGLLRRAQPEGELQPGRPADLLGQEPADAAPVHPADQFPHQVPVEQRRFAVRGPGLPRWRLRRQQRAQPVPVIERPGGHRPVQHHHPGLMRQHLTHRRRGAEPGPVPLHRRVQVEPPGLDQPQRAHRRERLADRIRLDHAARFPPPAPSGVGVTARQVHHQTAVAPRRERRAGARLRGEDPGETLAHQAEPPVGKPLHLHLAILAPLPAITCAGSHTASRNGAEADRVRSRRVKPTMKTDVYANRRSGVRHERGRPRLLPLITWSSACALRGGTGSRSKLGVPAGTRLSGSCGGRRARLGFHPLGGLGRDLAGRDRPVASDHECDGRRQASGAVGAAVSWFMSRERLRHEMLRSGG